MKRRVLCIFVLILWGLVFCTMLSVRIEQLMIPEVVLTQANESEPSPHVALDSLCGFPVWSVIFTILPVAILLFPLKIIGTLHIAAMVSMFAWIFLI